MMLGMLRSILSEEFFQFSCIDARTQFRYCSFKNLNNTQRSSSNNDYSASVLKLNFLYFFFSIKIQGKKNFFLRGKIYEYKRDVGNCKKKKLRKILG